MLMMSAPAPPKQEVRSHVGHAERHGLAREHRQVLHRHLDATLLAVGVVVGADVLRGEGLQEGLEAVGLVRAPHPGEVLAGDEGLAGLAAVGSPGC